MDKVKQSIEWAQKRLEIQGKKLDETQIEILSFALHEAVSKSPAPSVCLGCEQMSPKPTSGQYCNCCGDKIYT